MNIEFKFKIGQIVNYVYYKDETTKYLIVLAGVDENGVWYCNGRNTWVSGIVREEELSRD